MQYQSETILQKFKSNIFVAFSGMQYFMSKLIIESVIHRDPYVKNYLIRFSTRTLSKELDPENCEVINVPEVGSIKSVLFKLRLRVKLSLIRSKSNSVEVYVGHPLGLLENYLVFRYPRDRAYLMQEGILNFYNYTINDKLRAQMSVFKKKGWMYGFPYTIYDGHLSGIDQPNLFYGIYALDDTNLFGKPNNAIKINCSYQEASWAVTSTKILVLGQEIQSLVGAENNRLCNESLWCYVASTGSHEVVFKPHQAQSPSEVQAVMNVGISKGLRIELFESNDPVEYSITTIRPREIVSFSSSALANIRQLYPLVKCTSIGFEVFEKYLDLGPVRDYFKSNKVEFIVANSSKY